MRGTVSPEEDLEEYLRRARMSPATPEDEARLARENLLPPGPGESYEIDTDGYHSARSIEGPLLNSRGRPAGVDKLVLSKETLRDLQFQDPDILMGPPEPEEPRERIYRLQRDMVQSEHARCGNVVERGIGHTKMLICNIYLGLGGDWDPPMP